MAASALVAALAVAPAAHAYDETGGVANPADCAGCHAVMGVSVEATGVARTGPHGGYITTSRSCAGCHSTHGQPSTGFLLMPGATLTETCELCHDGTGGDGVYGTLAARGLTVESAHRTEATSVVPGGDATTGGTSTVNFSGQNLTLSCGDCHSPHGSEVVEPFTSDRMRIATDTAGFYSSELLKRRPTGSISSISAYGSDWCGACHKGRLSGLHEVVNHPVDTSSTAGFVYEQLQVVDGIDSTATEFGTLGRNNFGFVMPYPRTAGQGTHKPICQQCHDDVRSVGDVTSGSVAPSETFSVTSPDGGAAGDNPRFQVFPHESANAALLLETGDDLCTNCHHSGQLP